MDRLSLISPWVDYYRKLEALFSGDPGVKVLLNNKHPEIKILVEDGEKAEALQELLPMNVTYGNVNVAITVVPANGKTLSAGRVDKVQKAFEGNEALAGIYSVEGIFANPINYVVFKPWIVQYFNDDLSDAHGIRSTLYQDLAKEVFGEDCGVFFCTDVVEKNGKKVGMPLGEWP